MNIAIERCSQFSGLPNAVIGYDFPAFLRRAFNQFPSLEQSGFKANQGFALKADKHFRLWWEINWKTNHRINRMFNGAGFSPYSSALMDCAISAVEPEDLPMDSSTRKSGIGSHRISGVSFGKRGEYFCAHVLPSDHIFTVEGQSIPIRDAKDALDVLAYLNTPLIRFALNKYCGQHKYSGYVNLLPWVRVEQREVSRQLVLDSIKSMAKAQQQDELQSYFYALTPKATLQELAEHLSELIRSAWSTAKECEAFCENEIARQLSLTQNELASIKNFYLSEPSLESPIQDADTRDGCKGYTSHGIQSYTLGCVFGRWDIRYATGEKPAPELPDPFASLPICPPGMLQNAEGLPAAPADVPADYPLHISWPGILVDDEGQREDIVGRMREALRVVWGERADAIEQEACDILGVKSLRDYFRKPASFFDDHLKRYSKSRRQAPIYWPLSTASGSYTLWLYYHRLNDQTLYSCVNDFLDPKLAESSRQTADLRKKTGRSQKEEEELSKLTSLELELQDFRTELLRIAQFWKPNLNDGVQITAAPLWKLFGHRAWQKKLKETWQALEAGEYDWAHAAYSIWPERVREKCRSDKSLAIAHGLEDVYIAQPATAKKGRGRGKQAKAFVEDE